MHFFIKKILEKKTRDLLCKSVWRFNDNCSLHLNTDTDLQYFGWNLSRQIQLLHLLSSMCFFESDHSIFSLLHFPLGKSTLGQAASCSPTTKVSERHLVANEISIQKKKTYTKVYPFRLMLEARKRGRVLKLVPECLVVKETRHLFPLFSYLAHLLRSLATKVSRAENEA